MPVVAPFPNVLITGMDPDPTRWLRFNLDRHPDICAPPLDIHFFSDPERMAERGLRWYCEQFVGWDGEPFRVEESTTYADHRYNLHATTSRILHTIPDVTMVLVLGNPIDLFEAEWRRRVRWGQIEPEPVPARFADLRHSHPELHQVATFELYFGNIQVPILRAFRDRYGDRLHTLLIDDIRADPEQAYRSVLAAIGADQDEVPPDLDLVRYGDPDRWPELRLSLSDRQYLYAFFRSDVEGLARLLDRDLSSWDPGAGPDTPTPEEVAETFRGDG